MNNSKANLRAFQLKGSLLTLTVLQLLKTDMPSIQAQFLSLVKQTPDLFQRMPIVIDLSKIATDATPIDFTTIYSMLRQHGLIPVGVRGGSVEHQAAASAEGLPILPNARNEQPDLNQLNQNNNVEATKAKLVTLPVRSGQQVYAKNADLIVLNAVSPGAEILADGNIHVYGSLRGRALAGVGGNKEARIFCQDLDAELVSIAGHYWINEDLNTPPIGKSVQIYLENDRLQMGTF